MCLNICFIFHQCVQLSPVHHKWSVWRLFASVCLEPFGRIMNVYQVKNANNSKIKHNTNTNNTHIFLSGQIKDNSILLGRLFALFLSAQVFPGELHLINEDFLPQMTNRSSEVFRNTAAKIEEEVSYAFII